MNEDALFRQWLARVERDARLEALRDAPEWQRQEWDAPWRGPYAPDVDRFLESMRPRDGRNRRHDDAR